MAKKAELKCSHREDKYLKIGGGGSFHNVYVYQSTMMYTLESYSFICQFYLNKTEFKKI